ncbi:MAG: hypothetical protein C0606_06180 [Hyphomicrobiales bacterium]|nr:MAG: hypothetical protein C0606_06180 [Hyphomicrobiales bacterium]
MTHPLSRLFLSAALAGTMLFGLAGGIAAASQATVGPLTVSGPFARATPGAARAGIAYLTIRNAGGEPDRLVSAAADVSDRVELHTHIEDNGILRMRQVEAIDVPANGMTALKPGGLHVMFIGLKAPLKKGQHFPLSLTFEKAGTVTIEMPVGSIGAMRPEDDSAASSEPAMDHSAMDHSKMDHGEMAPKKTAE